MIAFGKRFSPKRDTSIKESKERERERKGERERERNKLGQKEQRKSRKNIKVVIPARKYICDDCRAHTVQSSANDIIRTPFVKPAAPVSCIHV